METRECRNCYYFIKHYANTLGYYTEILGCGHCINPRIKTNPKPCSLWKPEELCIKERHKKIQDMLLFMAKRIEDIADILEKDNNV